MFYLGIDVAKAKLDCCLLLDPDSTKRKSKSVANTKAGFATLLEWVARKVFLFPNSMPSWKAPACITNKPLWHWSMPA